MCIRDRCKRENIKTETAVNLREDLGFDFMDIDVYKRQVVAQEFCKRNSFIKPYKNPVCLEICL